MKHNFMFPVLCSAEARIKLFIDIEWMNKLLAVEMEQLSGGTWRGLGEKDEVLFIKKLCLLGNLRDF
jgi:hypothetical protein